MSRPQLLETPTVRPPGQPAAAVGGQARTCRFRANCSCVFNRVEQAPAVPDAPASTATGLSRAAAEAELAVLRQRGWKVVSADAREIVLERQRNMPFCVDVLLCAVTVMLWSIHMVWRARHPRIETTTLVLAS